jgi:cytochrome c peroxidase
LRSCASALRSGHAPNSITPGTNRQLSASAGTGRAEDAPASALRRRSGFRRLTRVGAANIRAGAAWLVFLGFGCREPPDTQLQSLRQEEHPKSVSAEPIGVLPAAPDLDPPQVALGRRLFFSTIISGDGRVSCASCHFPAHGYADPRALSQPEGRPETLTNAPTLLNVAFLDIFNWNGRFTSLSEHLDGLLQNPKIQGTSWSDVAERLESNDRWAEEFSRVFPGGATADNARSVVLAYERSLVSPEAPFDRWLRGDRAAISETARTGYELFKSRGCVSCHQGALVGGNLFQRLGVVKDYFEPDRVREADLGRFSITGREQDRYAFRVPSLRNVAETAPYLHDGSVPTLDKAVQVMATYQLGRDLDAEQVRQVVAFLETLTGQYAKDVP